MPPWTKPQQQADADAKNLLPPPLVAIAAAPTAARGRHDDQTAEQVPQANRGLDHHCDHQASQVKLLKRWPGYIGYSDV